MSLIQADIDIKFSSAKKKNLLHTAAERNLPLVLEILMDIASKENLLEELTAAKGRHLKISKIEIFSLYRHLRISTYPLRGPEVVRQIIRNVSEAQDQHDGDHQQQQRDHHHHHGLPGGQQP